MSGFKANIKQYFLSILLVCLLCSPALAVDSLSQGLIGYWDFEGVSGASIADKSGSGLTGTLTGGATVVSSSVPATQFKNTACIQLDGVDDYMEGTNSNIYKFGQNVDFTVSAWMKTDFKTPNTFPYVVATENVNSRTGFGLIYQNSGSLVGNPFFLSRTSCCPGAASPAAMNIADNKWHHLLGVRRGDQAFLYVDGVLVGTQASGAGVSLALSGQIRVGLDPSGFFPYKGLVDDVRVYNRALSEKEIKFLAAGYNEIKTTSFDLGPQFTQGKALVGKVFEDINSNGEQDSGERGLEGVKVASDSGIYAITDSDGKYHFPYIETGQRVLKIDESTLPEGSTITTESPRKIVVTEGILSKVSFGVSIDRTRSVEDTFKNMSPPDPVRNAPLLKVTVSQDPVLLKPKLSIEATQDKDKLTFTIHTNYALFINKAEIIIYGADLQEVKRILLPQPLPYQYEMDVKDPPESFSYQLMVTDDHGQTDRTAVVPMLISS